VLRYKAHYYLASGINAKPWPPWKRIAAYACCTPRQMDGSTTFPLWSKTLFPIN